MIARIALAALLAAVAAFWLTPLLALGVAPFVALAAWITIGKLKYNPKL